MPKEFPKSDGSRLSRFAKGEHKEGTIAGRKVTQTEKARQKKKKIASTSIRIDNEIKEQAQALASLKQISFGALVEKALQAQLRKNAALMNQFTKFHIEDSAQHESNL